jgi:hypothetical protein
VRWSALRGDATVRPLEPLSLLALPASLRHVRPDDGAGPARRLPTLERRGADPRVPTGGRCRCQGILRGLRIEPFRGLVARRRRDLDPDRRSRRRPGDPAAVPYVRGLASPVGRAPRRRLASLFRGASEAISRGLRGAARQGGTPRRARANALNARLVDGARSHPFPFENTRQRQRLIERGCVIARLGRPPRVADLSHYFDLALLRRNPSFQAKHLAERANRHLDLVERRLAGRQPL